MVGGNAMLISFEEQPFLLQLESTAGDYPGQLLDGMPVLVGAVLTPRRSPRSL
jgi:hypothetical protein